MELMPLGSLNWIFYQENDHIIKPIGLTFHLLVWRNSCTVPNDPAHLAIPTAFCHHGDKPVVKVDTCSTLKKHLLHLERMPPKFLNPHAILQVALEVLAILCLKKSKGRS